MASEEPRHGENRQENRAVLVEAQESRDRASNVFRELFVRVVDNNYTMSKSEENAMKKFNGDAIRTGAMGGLGGFGFALGILRRARISPRVLYPTSIFGGMLGAMIGTRYQVNHSLASLVALPNSRIALEARIILTEIEGVDGLWQKKFQIKPFYELLAEVWAEQPPEIQQTVVNGSRASDGRGVSDDSPEWMKQIHPEMRVGPRLSPLDVPKVELIKQLEQRRIERLKANRMEEDENTSQRENKETQGPGLTDDHSESNETQEDFSEIGPDQGFSSYNPSHTEGEDASWGESWDRETTEATAGGTEPEHNTEPPMHSSRRRAAERRERREKARRRAAEYSERNAAEHSQDPTDSFTDDWDPSQSEDTLRR
mmetsp:Transcript_2081/g.4615  ORF Transcript_2081/g.4615 Transcript_2081/m.4615 type:complete len:371 (-) Transcript_2081:1173-2285(-)